MSAQIWTYIYSLYDVFLYNTYALNWLVGYSVFNPSPLASNWQRLTSMSCNYFIFVFHAWSCVSVYWNIKKEFILDCFCGLADEMQYPVLWYYWLQTDVLINLIFPPCRLYCRLGWSDFGRKKLFTFHILPNCWRTPNPKFRVGNSLFRSLHFHSYPLFLNSYRDRITLIALYKRATVSELLSLLFNSNPCGP